MDTHVKGSEQRHVENRVKAVPVARKSAARLRDPTVYAHRIRVGSDSPASPAIPRAIAKRTGRAKPSRGRARPTESTPRASDTRATVRRHGNSEARAFARFSLEWIHFATRVFVFAPLAVYI